MTRSLTLAFDPALDLVLERIVDVPTELVWKAWTTPDQLKRWFTPRPWRTLECEIDLRPGGMLRTVMESPEGQRCRGVSCYLEVIENEKLVWTNALEPGYRPARTAAACPGEEFVFTAVISIEPVGDSTKYTALVIHGTPKGRAKHEAMGFHDGWRAALDQMIAMIKSHGG